MTTGPETELARRAADRRRYMAAAEAADPAAARRDRKWAASKGWASEYDDPLITVRCSEIEALTGAHPEGASGDV